MQEKFNCKFTYNNIQGHYIITFMDNMPLITPESTVFDCGSFRGIFTYITKISFNPTVYMFEPNRTLHQITKDVWEGQKTVIPINKAINSKNGKKKFYVRDIPKNSSFYKSHRGNIIDSYYVDTVTLDKAKEEHNVDFIDLIKLDIEGSELDVLMSLDKDFFIDVLELSIEYHLHSKIKGYTEEKVLECRKHLRDCGMIEVKYHPKNSCYINIYNAIKKYEAFNTNRNKQTK